jgi:uncharacterized membrane protein required for colicin V production
MYLVFFAIVMFAGIAMTVREGLWSNALTLICIIVSGLVAFGFYSPLVVYLDEQVTNGQHTYWLDFAIIWALYAVTMIVMRTLTGAASNTRLRFKNPIDPVGGPIVGAIAAWVLAGFVLATLHTVPMGKDAFGGGLLHGADASPITTPDVAWLNFVETMTQPSAMGTGPNKNYAGAFIKIYGDHRAAFDKADGLIVKRGGP